ncbi:MAG TPA: EAL domain-containing protein [Terriglobales bacterium]|nr:EAL domain-containing protein [Terriglobales bacterium]
MDQQGFQEVNQNSPEAIPTQMRQIEGREWWLWGFAVAVTLALTLGIVSFTFPWFRWDKDSSYWFDLREWVRGLAALVLLFDFYTVYQHFQLHRIRRQLAERDQLFQLISENAADMIALVGSDGRRLYNSPAYQKVLGYSPEDLKTTSSFDQIHPDDRPRVLKAAEQARLTGHGEPMEYRIRHKDGSWRTLESTASPVRNAKGQTDKLVIVNRDITERKRAEELLAHNAFHDGLTNLPNRALFLDRLQHALTLSKRHANYKFAVLLIDIDEFKIVNDSLGHTAGDELLIKIGQRLKDAVRRADTVSRPRSAGVFDKPSNDDTLARLGGDEFTILLDDIRDPIEAVRVAERVQAELATPFVVNQQEIVISASIGIAASTSPHTEAEHLLRDADIAMYRAKRTGKARCEVSDTAMHEAAVKRLRLETDLRKALDQGEFRVFYQPIVSLQTGKITGFEALTRWQRSEGIVPPIEFITVAEEIGLIIPMNRQLRREACQQLQLWQSQFPANPPLTMSVNITPKEFAQPDLASEIGKSLAQIGFDPACLQLEIIETIAMGDAEKSGQVLAQLKALGVRLSIDDFGTGYSSLSRLRRIPVDTLKIDRAFIMNMDSDPESHEIVRVIIMLAHNLGLKVVAEGTETQEHVRLLKQLNCETAQGYNYSRPADAQAMSKLLASNRSASAASAGR